MQSGTIFIQPHSDDMVMSSYFLIKAEILPRPYYLLTMFGQSSWIDPIKRKKYKKFDVPEVTSIRRIEDERLAKLFGLELLFCDLADCLLREGRVYYRQDSKLDLRLLREVRMMLIKLLKERKIRNIVAPFPAGRWQHYDHRLVCEAVKFLSVNSYNIFFADDIPYSRISQPNKHGLHLFSKTGGDPKDKFKAMKIYDSQMCQLFFKQARKLSRQNHGHERLFALTKQ